MTAQKPAGAPGGAEVAQPWPGVQIGQSLDPAAAAVLAPQFAALAQAGLDLGTIRTWDPRLSRRTRILVPVDVQAFVVTPGRAEPVVALAGGPADPPPFAAGTLPPAGIHLHWAMPDALLAAATLRERSTDLTLPALPDRWVVVRTLQPVGARRVSVLGWVIDARSGSVTPLSDYTGTPAAAPPGSPVLDPLDGVAGGSLMWTASYWASAGRFGFHDPLTDLAGRSSRRRWHADQAVYTVAGWWSEPDLDPLTAAVGPARLHERLAQLRWHLGPDGADEATTTDQGPTPASGLPVPAEPAQPSVVLPAGGPLPVTAGDATVLMSLPGERQFATLLGPPLPRYATLLHGSVLGVPIAGTLPAADDRPSPRALGVSVGQDIDDVVAALGARALRPDQRRSAETLVAALTSGLIDELGSPDGLANLAEREHADGFWALPGTPLPGARLDRLRAQDGTPLGPLAVGRKGRAAGPTGASLAWDDGTPAGAATPDGAATAAAREVIRAAPRYFRPQPPIVALRGACPNHRHHGDGMFDGSGRLRCRYPAECVTEFSGVVSGAAVLPSLGSGAVPAETLTVAREAVLLNPYGYEWLAAAGASAKGLVDAFATRLAAEMVRLHGVDGRYDSTSHLAASTASWSDVSAERSMMDDQVGVELARHSLLAGCPPSPVALTNWRQPWVPLWLEWRVTLDGHDSVAGWQLAALDLEPTTPPAEPGQPVTKTLVGRSSIGRGVSAALHGAIRRWLEAERRREATDGGAALSTSDRAVLSQLADLLGASGGVAAALDVVSASLDGVREQLLGIPYVGVVDRTASPAGRPQATGEAVPLFAGALRIGALRLVDAFGRVLDVPADAIGALATTADLELPGLTGGPAPPGIRMRPRIQHKARWLLRLVDPSQPATTAPADLREAYVDQIDPAGAVNPVAGFLLPDHIDEELEVFTAGGRPVGALGHDAVSGAVTWEPAPGRRLPPDAAPGDGLDAHEWIMGELAAGLLRADALGRDAARIAGRPTDLSALTALLRTIDTTLWTIDTLAAIGSPTVAGLVGRPVAVARAVLRLDAPDDLDDVDVLAPGGIAARRAAFAALAEQRFPVRLGTLTRSDDALLAFYVDDDYSRVHLVDRVIAAHAVESGRHRGHLGLLNAVRRPGAGRLAHPYLVTDPTLWLRPGQTVRLTLLMLPAGRVHLTSGILPRKQVALGEDWVAAGLARLVPSVRVGPVLIDPSEIRLPLVHLLGEHQTFTRRTGPLTWRDDPILAATQAAYLPRLPHEVQEGWVRVTTEQSSTTPSTGDVE